MPLVTFNVDGHPLIAEIQDLVIAGWTGRDTEKVEHHIVEMEAISALPVPSQYLAFIGSVQTC